MPRDAFLVAPMECLGRSKVLAVEAQSFAPGHGRSEVLCCGVACRRYDYCWRHVGFSFSTSLACCGFCPMGGGRCIVKLMVSSTVFRSRACGLPLAGGCRITYSLCSNIEFLCSMVLHCNRETSRRRRSPRP